MIKIESVSKQYRLGTNQLAYQTLRDRLADFTSFRLNRRGNGNGNGNDNTIWALRDINFEVAKGEVLGIIGRNGAGKSTLLKILSRITEPTTGRIELYGRVGSLLEVGTGFHPELTGRENIFLNGVIMGMKRRELARKFDEIVAFAEISKFIDTPVKRYSSGMYVRLAFAVAAHLEPEILIVDEVLAVGDDLFQKKCLGKMATIAGEGRTVIFVSHNMPAVTNLCPRAILLDQGGVVRDGNSADVTSYYLSSGGASDADREWNDISTAPGDEIVRLRRVSVVDENGDVCPSIDIRKKVGIRLEYEILHDGRVLLPGFSITTEAGQLAFYAGDSEPDWQNSPRPKGRYVSTGWIPGNFLNAGTMIVGVTVSQPRPTHKHVHEQGVLSFQVIDRMGPGTARGNYPGRHFAGAVRPLLQWKTDS
ncbi:MAG TPA: ABC transporter ATP-binding protein [Pyrinomonadaceae bacterium]|nr:ABC transporter ATP-binding protein [Pyrinomonadaceae bacterium]